jgi:murein DD-endopeptidase MepM/ murein hydrolase activator NlpD
MMRAMKPHGVFILLLSSLLIGACATRPLRGDRHGLLDSTGGSVRLREITDAKDNDVTHEVMLTGQWHWPLKNVDVSSHYGNRGRKFHQGADFRAHIGTPVLAANDGVVVYVGSRIRGYGRMIVLKHDDGFYSVYAHHSKNLVKVGKLVSRGDKIALSGRSGRASGPHLHFEIRRGVESLDPIVAINDNLKRYVATRKVASEEAVQQ